MKSHRKHRRLGWHLPLRDNSCAGTTASYRGKVYLNLWRWNRHRYRALKHGYWRWKMCKNSQCLKIIIFVVLANHGGGISLALLSLDRGYWVTELRRPRRYWGLIGWHGWERCCIYMDIGCLHNPFSRTQNMVGKWAKLVSTWGAKKVYCIVWTFGHKNNCRIPIEKSQEKIKKRYTRHLAKMK